MIGIYSLFYLFESTSNTFFLNFFLFIVSFLGMFDRDNSGAIEFNEFYALWQYVTDWQRTFRSYDQDNSGTIDLQELKIGNKHKLVVE